MLSFAQDCFYFAQFRVTTSQLKFRVYIQSFINSELWSARAVTNILIFTELWWHRVIVTLQIMVSWALGIWDWRLTGGDFLLNTDSRVSSQSEASTHVTWSGSTNQRRPDVCCQNPTVSRCWLWSGQKPKKDWDKDSWQIKQTCKHMYIGKV